MKYAILISAGIPIDYAPKVGWNNVCDTRAEAEAMCARAEKNSGWSAKVITLSDDEAAAWHETPQERIARERAEAEAERLKNSPQARLAAQQKELNDRLRNL